MSEEQEALLVPAAVVLFEESRSNMAIDAFMKVNLDGTKACLAGELHVQPVFIFKMAQGLSAWTCRMTNMEDKRNIDKALRSRVYASIKMGVPAQSYFAMWGGWVGLPSGRKDCVWQYGEVGDDRRLFYSLVERETPLGPLLLKEAVEVKDDIGEGLFLNMLYGTEAGGGTPT